MADSFCYCLSEADLREIRSKYYSRNIFYAIDHEITLEFINQLWNEIIWNDFKTIFYFVLLIRWIIGCNGLKQLTKKKKMKITKKMRKMMIEIWNFFFYVFFTDNKYCFGTCFEMEWNAFVNEKERREITRMTTNFMLMECFIFILWDSHVLLTFF